MIAKLLLAATALAGTVAATAQTAAPARPTDGPRTKAEVMARTQAMFARVDANKDGFIDRSDMTALRERRGAAKGERHAQMFDRLDADRNGAISREEWGRMAALRAERGPMQQRMNRGPGAMGGRGAMMMRMSDSDNDGRISLAEATAAATRRFDRVDANRDGTVTPDERQKARQDMRQQRGMPAAR